MHIIASPKKPAVRTFVRILRLRGRRLKLRLARTAAMIPAACCPNSNEAALQFGAVSSLFALYGLPFPMIVRPN